MRHAIARVGSFFAWLVLAAMLFQIYAAGMGVFGASSFEVHRVLGLTFEFQALLLVVLMLVGRMGRDLVALSMLLFVLTYVQIGLANVQADLPWVAALHPLNGMALLGLSFVIARRSWKRA